jgi:hypothetical protein
MGRRPAFWIKLFGRESMNENGVEWFSESVAELEQTLHDVNVDPLIRQGAVLARTGIIQARVAYDNARSQERLVKNLVRATWALVGATLVVAVVAIWG